MTEMADLGFSHTKMIVLVTDGGAHQNRATLKSIKSKIQHDEIKVRVHVLIHYKSSNRRVASAFYDSRGQICYWQYTITYVYNRSRW